MQFTYRNPVRSTDPSAAVPGAQAVFVGALAYGADEPQHPVGPSGRVARYAWSDHYGRLREGLWTVAKQLRADGFKAVPFADDNSIVDREVAYLAGLGWFGKNANLLVSGAGSWFVLGCVVTSAPLPVAATPVADGCGACHRCIDNCPTSAIVAPGVIDAGRCLSWVLQKPGVIPVRFRETIGSRIYGCDDCQDVCPPTVRFGVRSAPVEADPPVAWVAVLDLLDADDAGVIAAWGRWYLAGRDPRWARRNALVVLGNVGDGSQPRIAQMLARYVKDPDLILRVHAIWAARRLGLHRLVVDADVGPANDPDGLIAAELAGAVVTR